MNICEVKMRVPLITKDIMRYLNIVAKNPRLSAINHLLLYLQKVEGEVNSKMVWEAMGKRVKDNTKSIGLFYPEIVVSNEECKINFKNISVISESDTEGDAVLPTKNVINIMDKAAYLTHSAQEIVDQRFPFNQKGMYDASCDIFYVSKSIKKEEELETWIPMLVNWTLAKQQIVDKELMMAIRYVVLSYYKCNVKSYQALLFQKLESRTKEELLEFILNLAKYSWLLINELGESIFNWNETIYLNTLLITDKKEDLIEVVQEVMDCLVKNDTEQLYREHIEELAILKNKLVLLDVQDLYEKKIEGELTIYPACNCKREYELGGKFNEYI